MHARADPTTPKRTCARCRSSPTSRQRRPSPKLTAVRPTQPGPNAAGFGPALCLNRGHPLMATSQLWIWAEHPNKGMGAREEPAGVRAWRPPGPR